MTIWRAWRAIEILIPILRVVKSHPGHQYYWITVCYRPQFHLIESLKMIKNWHPQSKRWRRLLPLQPCHFLMKRFSKGPRARIHKWKRISSIRFMKQWTSLIWKINYSRSSTIKLVNFYNKCKQKAKTSPPEPHNWPNIKA